MNPLIVSVLATLFIILGGATVFIMLEMTGRTRDHTGKTGRSLAGSLTWIRVHKILGYLFLSLFTLMLVFMIRKVAGFQEELTSRAVFHIVLALILIPLVVIKVLVVRRHPQLSTKLPMLGIAIFTLSFGLTGITAGYYVLHRSNLTYTTLSALDNDVLDLELGKAIMNRKCSKCHSLERVYRAYKSESGWAGTINKMALLDSPNVTTFDVKQVLNYLIEQQKKRQEKSSVSLEQEIGKTLVSRKCSVCHNLDRIFGADKNKREWTSTVSRMAATMGDPDFLSEQEKSDIITFLNGREMGK
jgi:cytochrome c2